MIARATRSAALRLLDARDRALGRADALVPPRRLNFVGDSDFQGTGDEFMRLFVDLAGLRPDERVLDVGSGIGRMARPLAGYLRPPGAYEGFDIVPDGVAWCRDRYSGYSHFRFQVADVTNGMYRPDGGVPASEYRFPFGDASFDFAFATSVFTHLLPAEADRYIAEMVRVTRPGGRLLATFFLLGTETPSPAGGGRLTFPHDHGVYATDSDETPEAAVAYREEWVRDRLASHGLRVQTHHGAWSGRPGGLSLQDIVVATRPGAGHSS